MDSLEDDTTRVKLIMMKKNAERKRCVSVPSPILSSVENFSEMEGEEMDAKKKVNAENFIPKSVPTP